MATVDPWSSDDTADIVSLDGISWPVEFFDSVVSIKTVWTFVESGGETVTNA